MQSFLLSLSDYQLRPVHKLMAWCIYFIGIAHWIILMPAPETNLLAVDDWRFAHYYYSVWQSALNQGIFPYQVQPLLQPTDFFWAIPEMIFSPQLLLLSILDLGQFAIANILFQYTIGCIASYYWLKQMHCSILMGIIFWLLFNFNGFIVAHLAVGHFVMGGYYLLPFFAAFIEQILQANGKNNQYSSLYLIATMIAIFLQGSFHLYIWCSCFLLFIALFNHFVRRQIIMVLVWSILLLSFRCLPAIFAFYGQTRFHFVGGFPTLSHLLESLIHVKHFNDAAISTYFGHLGSWELDMYIDISGLLFLLLFAVYFSLPKYIAYQQSTNRYLYLPLLAMFSLSISYVYGIIAKLPFPLLHSERVSSRFFSLVLLFLIGMAVARCQSYLTHLTPDKRLLAIITLLFFALLLGLSLAHHSLVWRIDNIAIFCPNATMPLSNYHLISPANNDYKIISLIGATCSILSLLLLIITRFRTKLANTK